MSEGAAEIPERVKETLRGSGVDGNVIVGVLTLESEHCPRYYDGDPEEGGELIL